MAQLFFPVLVLVAVVLTVLHEADFAAGQLTFTPGWRTRILSKVARSTRSDSKHSLINVPKRDQGLVSENSIVRVVGGAEEMENEEARICETVQDHLAKLFMTDSNVSIPRR